MKKKISLWVCVLAAMLCFTACGNQTEAQYDEDSMEETAEFIISYCSSADDLTLEQWYSMSEFSVNLQLAQAGLTFDADAFVSVLKSWQAGVEECGAYLGHDAYTCKAQNGSVELRAPAQFEDRDGVIVFVFDETSGQLESLTVSADMETGEILRKAGLNTLLGMGTVFCVLILIALIISLFHFIPKIQAAFSRKEKAPEQAEPAAEAVISKAEEEAVPDGQGIDDGELIAVIAAAVAAAEGTAADGFVVRGIRRRPSNKWNSR